MFESKQYKAKLHQHQRSCILSAVKSHETQNSNTTLKMRFSFFYTGVLWRAGSSEHRVIPTKLMKRRWKYPLKVWKGVKIPPKPPIKSGRGWKYPLKSLEGGEGTSFKDRKFGVLKKGHKWALIIEMHSIYSNSFVWFFDGGNILKNIRIHLNFQGSDSSLTKDVFFVCDLKLCFLWFF